jgi:hypothetical protein
LEAYSKGPQNALAGPQMVLLAFSYSWEKKNIRINKLQTKQAACKKNLLQQALKTTPGYQ